MKTVYYDKDINRVPIKSWTTNIEDAALDQATNVSRLPFVYKHVALMPDCHCGYGVPIGSVMAAKGVVVPNAVGVDIGCGMSALKTPYKRDNFSIENFKEISKRIREVIPMGKNNHQKPQELSEFEDIFEAINHGKIEVFNTEKARYSFSTLGGGNHFIELQTDFEDSLWIMIHSGSRRVGFEVAKHYNEIAKNENKTWFSSVDESLDLAFLPEMSRHYSKYLEEMDLCVEFAKANRRGMLNRVCRVLDSIGKKHTSTYRAIDIAHNYARYEKHYGEIVMVHRKGATLATKNTIGIIPGSQGTASYIVRGKGNPDSFCSCSHGAGRIMSRTKAKQTFDFEIEKKRMDEMGIIHNMDCIDDLDECASAYKNIDEVMRNQADLVEVVYKLTPVVAIKAKNDIRQKKNNKNYLEKDYNNGQQDNNDRGCSLSL